MWMQGAMPYLNYITTTSFWGKVGLAVNGWININRPNANILEARGEKLILLSKISFCSTCFIEHLGIIHLFLRT